MSENRKIQALLFELLNSELYRIDKYKEVLVGVSNKLASDHLDVVEKFNLLQEVLHEEREYDVLELKTKCLNNYYKLGSSNIVPAKHRFYKKGQQLEDMPVGTWVATTIVVNREHIDKYERHPSYEILDKGGSRVSVMRMGIVYRHYNRGSSIGTTLRFISRDGKVIENTHMNLCRECTTKQKLYVLRRSFRKLQIRKWLYRPGGPMFRKARESFDILAQNNELIS